jgi:hypothetical protein
MKCMMFIKHTEDYRGKTPPAGLYEAMGKFVQEGFASGLLIDTAGLKPTSDATRVRLQDRKIKVTDGPFTESKEIVGGYALVNVRSKEHALEVAHQFMDLHLKYWPEFNGECEVRPLEDMPG